MKNIIFLMLIIFGLSVFSIQNSIGQTQKSQKIIPSGNQDYKAEWETIDGFIKKSLPKSALEVVNSVYKKSKESNNSAQFIKALLFKIKLQSDFEENAIPNSIREIENELLSAKFPIKPILHSALAELYWKYYQSNRYTILERSQTTNFKQNDIETWDLRKITTAVISNYRNSLQNAHELKSIEIKQFEAILEKGIDSRKFRPTLYDFLAHRAIDFFMDEESELTMSNDAFELSNKMYFADSKSFINLKFTTSDSLSFKYYAIKLIQELTNFHISDKVPEALIDIELKRIEFVHQKTILQFKDSLYLKALLQLEQKYADAAISTEISYLIAKQYEAKGGRYNPLISQQYKWELKTALTYCETAIKKFPQSDGAVKCKILKEALTTPDLSLIADRVNLPGKPMLGLVNFKNTNKIYFKIAKIDPEQERNIKNKMNTNELVAEYNKLTVIQSWDIPVLNNGDFQHHSMEFKIPLLNNGFYILMASNSQNFSCKNEIVAFRSFWVSNISYFNRNKDNGSIEYFVMNRETGLPLKHIGVNSYIQDYDYKTRNYINKPWSSFTTNEEGYFEIPALSVKSDYKYFYLEFNTKGDRYITDNYFSQYERHTNNQQKTIRTYFFTDRSIYRPGQTVFFKGILLETEGEKTVIKPNQNTNVAFFDVNGQKISELKLTSNDYGSVSGSFTAPSTGLTGNMRIQNEWGSSYFSVEEYKRPKFEVNFNPVKGSFKLDENISVTANVKAYAGNAIDQAKVKFRVVRSASFPFYCWWWRYYPNSPEMEITNGNTVTNEKGEFSINFTAIPDLSIDKSLMPVFNYTISADVIDINGETHSKEQSVSVGYNALLINIDIPYKVNKTKKYPFKISTTNLNGNPEPNSGKILIYKLKPGEKTYRNRNWSKPDIFAITKAAFEIDFPLDVYNDENEINKWEKEKIVFNYSYKTPSDSTVSLKDLNNWEQGNYFLEMKSTDQFGTDVSIQKYFTVFSPSESKMPDMSIDWFTLLKNKAEPGEKVSFLIGSKEKDVNILYEIECKNQIINKQWLQLSNEQKLIEIPIEESHRGNLTIHLSFIKNNRSYCYNEIINVPYSNKKLDISFETFRNKLLPGQKEEWKININGSQGEKLAAEMLASMYDASLDAFKAHNWNFNIFNSINTRLNWETKNSFTTNNSSFCRDFNSKLVYPHEKTYDCLNWFGLNYYYGGRNRYKNARFFDGAGGAMNEEAIVPMEKAKNGAQLEDKTLAGDNTNISSKENDEKPSAVEKQNAGFSDVKLRSNFNETAFFFPQLLTNDSGEVIISFTVPESLTKWKMQGIAYTKDLKIGEIEKELLTQKDLMVVPNAPRFFREGDNMSFNVKISNISENDLNGNVRLQFFNAISMQPIDGMIKENMDKSVIIKAGQSQSVSWNINIPEGLGAVTYKVVAKAGNFSDGEELAIPVLTNRMLVTETMPLPINGKQTKNFTFSKLLNSKASPTLKNHSLTLEFTSNPAWYAVQALPYIMEYPYECSEQLFSRFYANSLASFIANSSPKIKNVFENWKNISKDALLSNLEKNQELKSLLIEETPWLLDAKNENERKKRIGLLFDINKMSAECGAAKQKLLKTQLPNGGWAWFAGGIDDRYITQYIVSGFGHLQHLGINTYKNDNQVNEMLRKAIVYLDNRIKEDYEYIKKWYPKDISKNHLNSIAIQYLYARSYFTDVFELASTNKEAFNYFEGQLQKYWTLQSKYLQGMIALSLKRNKDIKTPIAIISSLKENALYSEEMGMYWKELTQGYYWYQAPIETMALLIECFDEVANDQQSVEKMKIWLLKQKQTQDWKTTKATSEAIYALLLKGTDLLSSDKLVEVSVGGNKVNPYETDKKPEAGSGYFKTNWTAKEITPEMANVTVSKSDDGVAWGAMYWQYFEQLDKITNAATPLKLEKKLFVERNTANGVVIEPISYNSQLKVGDKVKVRIELRVDRDMEYIHLKDMRAAAFEPVNVLSSYKWQAGLGYYESTRDASTNFFISYLQKGIYVFEYSLIATQSGDFSNGITSAQCMYAPEFSSHSEGIRVKVEK
ncbi:MAG: alpha-2-macroglobulin family protein [Bacteroidales bacterium]